MTDADQFDPAMNLSPLPAMPPRPARPLSTARLLLVAKQNSLAVFDEELFDELFVERRLFGSGFSWSAIPRASAGSCRTMATTIRA